MPSEETLCRRQRERRINIWLATRTYLAIEHLANRYGVIKRELIKGLVIVEKEKVLKNIKLDSRRRRTVPFQVVVTQ